MGGSALRFVLRPLSRLTFFSPKAIDHAAANLLQGLAALRSVRLAAAAFLWTLAAWIVLGFSCWFVMLAFDFGLSPLAALFVIVAIGLSMILPSAPAALGLFEAAVVAAVGLYGESRSDALSYALVRARTTRPPRAPVRRSRRAASPLSELGCVACPAR